MKSGLAPDVCFLVVCIIVRGPISPCERIAQKANEETVVGERDIGAGDPP